MWSVSCGLVVHDFVDCRYIDEGKNPQLYTKDCMEKALAKNEAVKGKIDVLRVCICSTE